MSILTRTYPSLLSILLAMMSLAWLSYYAYFLLEASKGIAPFLGDEFLYWLDAQAFAQENRWNSAFLIDNKRSMYGDFGAHGFAYMWIYGAWLKLFPTHVTFAPILLHLSCLIISILIIIKFLKATAHLKWMAALVLISQAIFALYSFSYMVETIQALFAVIATLLLIKIYDSHAPKPKFIYAYIGFLILLTLIRATWILWLVALIPLSPNRQQLWKNSLLFLLSVGIGFSIFKLSHAPYDGGFIPSFAVVLQSAGILAASIYFFEHLTHNLYTYFRYFYTPYYFIIKYLLCVGVLYLSWQAYQRSNRLVLAAALVLLLNLLTVIVWYDTFDWRDVRVLSGSYLLAAMIIITQMKKQLAISLITIQCALLPFVWKDTQVQLTQKQQSYQQQIAAVNLKEAYQEMLSLVEGNNLVISISIDLMPYGSILPLSLPLQDNQEKPLRYSVFFGAPEPLNGLKYFLLAPHVSTPSNSKTLSQNQYFKLVEF